MNFPNVWGNTGSNEHRNFTPYLPQSCTVDTSLCCVNFSGQTRFRPGFVGLVSNS